MRNIFRLLITLGTAATLVAQNLDPLVVSVSRAPLPLSKMPVAVDVIDGETLETSPALAVDDALKQSAAFGLFRRTGSLSANPTAQGLSLRNIGPNGAGRTLVLVDGIPLNDPFGGWVAWTKAPRLNLAGAEIVRGGGSSAWGSAALGGTVQLLSAPADESVNRIQIEAGEFGTFGAELSSATTRDQNTFLVAAKAFTSDGFRRTAPAFAGTIDRPTSLDQGWLQVAWSRTTDAGTTGVLSARVFQEERGNGTPLQGNNTREALVSARAFGQRDLWGHRADWTASAYVQTQEYSSLFTAVENGRSTERPVLDQYSVPADAAGASTTATWTLDDAVTTLGADVRWVRGETNERYFRVNDVFTRQRTAGGTQAIGGIFAQHDRPLGDKVSANFAARLDGWSLHDGHRRELNTTNGSVVRDDDLADRSGTEFSPRAGLVIELDHGWHAQAAAYRAFRVPTLNELYRPFRVGSVITEANPNLKTESLLGGEIGLHWSGESARWRFTGFTNDLENAVANVTLGTGPGVVPGVGFVPAGGLGRRRENLDLVRVRGFEIAGQWLASEHFSLRWDYLYSDAIVPATGRRLPQVPDHTAVLGVDWRPNAVWRVSAQARHLSKAYEDDNNRLPLDAATTIDLRVTHRLGDSREVFLAVENIFDEDVVSGHAPDGRIDLGTPRFTRVGLRWGW